MKFYRIVCYDMRAGILREYKKYAAALVLFLFQCVSFLRQQPGLAALYHGDGITVGDYFYYVFAGMSPFTPNGTTAFRFPALWMLIMVLALFLVLYYPYYDLMGYGKQVLVYSRSRTGWWLSKCVWVTGSILLYFVLLWVVILGFSLVSHASLSLSVSPYMRGLDPTLTLLPEEYLAAGDTLGWTLVGMPLAVAVTLGLVQMCLSLLIRPLYSFCGMIALLLASAYFLHPALPGNYAMALRSDYILPNGVSASTGAILCAGLSLLAIIVGAIVFSRYDILNKEE